MHREAGRLQSKQVETKQSAAQGPPQEMMADNRVRLVCTSTGPEESYRVESTEEAAIRHSRKRAVNEREERMNNREAQRVEALKVSAAKKAQDQETAANTAGPGPDHRNVHTEKEEQALAHMCTITSRSEEQCIQALAIYSTPGVSTTHAYHLACHILLEDGEPGKKGWGNLAQSTG